MNEYVNIWERPSAREIYLIAGWRQWADAGSISSGLPRYLIQQTNAEAIGELSSDDFYFFQIPGTHHLVRPTVRFVDGFPQALETPSNEFYYAGDEERGVVFFLGDEPQLKVESYVQAFLDAAEQLGVSRIVGLGGVYGELPYDKSRMVSAIYSRPSMKEELEALAVNLSAYEGGASIGSYLCRRAAEREMEFLSFYAFVPTYDFSEISAIGNTIRLENDFMAWLGVMRRVNKLLGIDFSLADLEARSEKLVRVVDKKVAELESVAPDAGVRAYMERLSGDFDEVTFEPLHEMWEEELRRIFDEEEDE